MTTDDMELVRQYAAHQSESAFAALVSRHTNLVYSAALRGVRDPQLAAEVTQAVFIILARKAGSLGDRTILPGWLYRTACFVSSSALKQEHRRQQREQEAYMQSKLDEAGTDAAWKQMSPLLEEAMLRLGQTDRDALVLRYFEGRTLNEVGAALGAGEDAAKKRVNRAVEKLRGFFKKRGVVLPAAVLTAAISANSVQAAPVALAKTVTAVAVAKGAVASGSTMILVKGALKLMALAKAKTTAFIGTAIIFAAGVTAIAVDDSLWDFSSYNLDKTPPGIVIIRPAHFAGGGQGGVASMLGKIGGRNTSFLNVICDAYDISGPRVIFEARMPEGRFDYAVSTTNKPDEKLQAEIKKQFGLVAHREIRETEVLLLKTNINNSSKMKLTTASDGLFGFSSSQMIPMNQLVSLQMICTNQPVSLLREDLETWAYRKPVIDQTGLSGRYDFAVDWPNPVGYVGEKGQRILKENLINELGLELVPTNLPVEMLVVEKVK